MTPVDRSVILNVLYILCLGGIVYISLMVLIFGLLLYRKLQKENDVEEGEPDRETETITNQPEPSEPDRETETISNQPEPSAKTMRSDLTKPDEPSDEFFAMRNDVDSEPKKSQSIKIKPSKNQ